MSANGSKASKTENWLIEDSQLRPTVAKLQEDRSENSQVVNEDPLVKFNFAPVHNAKSIMIHESHLIKAGGPLAALVTNAFKESLERSVLLCEEDDPVTFGVIRRALYDESIDMSEFNIHAVVKIVLCSHRWELSSLGCVLAKYIAQKQMIHGLLDLVAAKSIVEVGINDASFLSYFWRTVGEHFESIYNIGEHSLSESGCADPASSSLHSVFVQNFANLWELAVSTGFLHTFVRNVIEHSRSESVETLVDVVLTKAEGYVSGDSELKDIIKYALRGRKELRSFLEPPIAKQKASSRALRILALAILAISLEHAVVGIGCSSIWEIQVERKGKPQRRQAFFGQSMTSGARLSLKNVSQWHCSCRYIYYGPCPHNRLCAQITVEWEFDDKFKLEVNVTNVHGFPEPLVVSVLINTKKCECEKKTAPSKQLYCQSYRRQTARGDRVGPVKINMTEEDLHHCIRPENLITSAGSPEKDACVLNLQVIVDYPADNLKL